MLSIGYSDSPSSSSDESNKQDQKDVTSSQCGESSRTNSSQKKLSERFELLKQRRVGLTSSTKQCESQKSSGEETTEKCKKQRRKRKRNAQNEKYRELNQYMSNSFEVKDRNELFKKSKLDNEVDEAIKNRDFDRAEKISDEIVKRDFATRVKSAFEAKNFTEKKDENECHKRKKREKLKWSFDHKKRWETKGNM